MPASSAPRRQGAPERKVGCRGQGWGSHEGEALPDQRRPHPNQQAHSRLPFPRNLPGPMAFGAQSVATAPVTQTKAVMCGGLASPTSSRWPQYLTSQWPPGYMGRKGESPSGTGHLPERCCCHSGWKRNKVWAGVCGGSPSSCHFLEESPPCPSVHSPGGGTGVQREAKGVPSPYGQCGPCVLESCTLWACCPLGLGQVRLAAPAPHRAPSSVAYQRAESRLWLPASQLTGEIREECG